MIGCGALISGGVHRPLNGSLCLAATYPAVMAALKIP